MVYKMKFVIAFVKKVADTTFGNLSNNACKVQRKRNLNNILFL